MKSLNNQAILFATIICWLLIVQVAHCQVIPEERVLITLDDGRWIQLKKKSLFATEITLGKGEIAKKNTTWSVIKDTDDPKEDFCWKVPFFLQLKQDRFEYDIDSNGEPEVAIAPYCEGKSILISILIFTVKENSLELFRVVEDYNIVSDKPLLGMDQIL